jgi:hypothetical protein
MKIGYFLTRPFSLEVLTVLVICLSLLISRWHRPQVNLVFSVLRAQQTVAIRCTPEDRLLLVPYARWIAQIDAAGCPNDFFDAWQKYVSDVQALSAVERAETGQAIVSIAAMVITENPAPLLNAIPAQSEKVEIARNTAVADWQNVKSVAQRYGIKMTPINYSERVKQRNRA